MAMQYMHPIRKIMKIELTGEETNVDLQVICDELNLNVEAKNTKKPNKMELITAIEKNNGVDTSDDAVQTDTEGLYDENNISPEEFEEFMGGGTDDDSAKDITKKKKLTKKDMKSLLFKLNRVQVIANDETQSKRDVKFITWGNDVIGHNTDRLLMGRPWHIREGALRNLQDNVISKSVPHPETGNPEYVEVPAYNIIILPMLTIDQYRGLGKKQEIRDAAVEGGAI